MDLGQNCQISGAWILQVGFFFLEIIVLFFLMCNICGVKDPKRQGCSIMGKRFPIHDFLNFRAMKSMPFYRTLFFYQQLDTVRIPLHHH